VDSVYQAAVDAWLLLRTDGGGLDWAGLEVVAELMRVTNLERFVNCLQIVRLRATQRPNT
jgi:hypothetical protein